MAVRRGHAFIQLMYIMADDIAYLDCPGVSFICAFLPDGAALIVLGVLERWAWANDQRVRAFYCTPRRDFLDGCGAPFSSSDCFGMPAVQPCLDNMMHRATEHARLTWPSLGRL